VLPAGAPLATEAEVELRRGVLRLLKASNAGLPPKGRSEIGLVSTLPRKPSGTAGRKVCFRGPSGCSGRRGSGGRGEGRTLREDQTCLLMSEVRRGA
jgi:hypothetical protein